jgi:hypothetical protein
VIKSPNSLINSTQEKHKIEAWGEKEGQGNMTPQKANNNIIEDLMENKGITS